MSPPLDQVIFSELDCAITNISPTEGVAAITALARVSTDLFPETDHDLCSVYEDSAMTLKNQ